MLRVPGSIAYLTDLDALEKAAQVGRQMGSAGGFAVHPDQVDILNRTFSQTEAELDWAKRVIAVASEAAAKGQDVVRLVGRMIDLPIILRAPKIVEREHKLIKSVGRSGRI